MIERIIKASSNESDVVFDCFVGSGTTAVAAKKLKRNFLCADNNKKFVELANKRLNSINDMNNNIASEEVFILESQHIPKEVQKNLLLNE